MSPLRRRMIEGMTVRNLSPYTQRNQLCAVSRFARHIRISPAEVGPEQLRDYLNHLVGQKVSASYFNVNVAALRFLYTVVLERGWVLPSRGLSGGWWSALTGCAAQMRGCSTPTSPR